MVEVNKATGSNLLNDQVANIAGSLVGENGKIIELAENASQIKSTVLSSKSLEALMLSEALESHAAHLRSVEVSAQDVNRICYQIEERYWESTKTERAQQMNILHSTNKTQFNGHSNIEALSIEPDLIQINENIAEPNKPWYPQVKGH